jgi:hypothetical protein
MNAKRQLMGAAIAALLIASPAGAEKFSRSVGDVDSIEHESGVGRVLFRADLSTEENLLVRRALLRVPLGSVEFSRGMTLRIHPVTSTWSRGGVSWTNGWTRPGGDFDDLLHGRAEVSSSSQGEVIFDITVLAQEIIEHGAPNRGFILTRDPGEGLGLPESDLRGLESLTGATVQVEYRRRPSGPRGIDS